MSVYAFETVDVFTDERFGGNPLGVFPEALGLDTDQMQMLAAELNLSETAFVLPPDDPAHTARVRIFNRTAEMAFAGHPSIGTAYVVARRGRVPGDRLTLEVPAGVVRVEMRVDERGVPIGGRIEVPQPLTVEGEVPAATVADCLGIGVADVLTSTHSPVVATVGNPYVIAEVAAEALARCEPDRVAFRRALAAGPDMGGRFSIHVYVREGDRIRARMFAPLAGTWEDPATGSANAPLVALLLSLEGGDLLRVEVRQGIEMGRPSRLEVEARRTAAGIMATIAGACVSVFKGSFDAKDFGQ